MDALPMDVGHQLYYISCAHCAVAQGRAKHILI